MTGRILILQAHQRIVADQELMQNVQNMVLDIHDIIIHQIHDGQLEVSQHQIDFNITTHNKQMKIKSKSVPHLNFPVPEHSQQDQIKIKQMIRKQRQYEQYLENNAKQLEDKVKADEQQQKQILQEQRKRKFEQRKYKVFESIQEIKYRQEKRKKLNKDQNQMLNQVKNQKKLHEILAEKWKKVQENQQVEKEKIKEKLKQQKRISFEEIKQHAIRHDETMTKFKESRIAQSRVSQPEVKKFYQSIFMNRIVEEDEKFKQEFESKKLMARQLADKKSEYAAIVRQNYKPTVKQTTSAVTQSQLRASKSLSHLEMFHKGNDYMKEAHSRVKGSGHKSTIEGKLNREQNIKKQFFKYKNYLTEIRIKKNEDEKVKQISERLQRSKTYEKQIKKIMNEPGLSDQQKFIRAKLVTKRMENQGQKKNPFKLIDSINAKIQILKHVSQ